VFARDVAEAHEVLRGMRPLVALVDRDALMADGQAHPLLLMRGGALVTFRGAEERAEHFPFRLLALVKFVEDRARTCGRDAADASAEERTRPE